MADTALDRDVYFVDNETFPVRIYRAMRRQGKWRILESTDGESWLESDVALPALQIGAKAFLDRDAAMDYFQRWRDAKGGTEE